MLDKQIIRVFPRRTHATPDDDLVFIGSPPFDLPKADEVHVSCTFTWDIEEAKKLYKQWGVFYNNIKLGGPAFGDTGDSFVSGMYLKPGYVITSRGCSKQCKFCLVPEREGKIKHLQIVPGFDIIDNNLLACSRDHIEAVLSMLENQSVPVKFTGGLDVFLMKDWFLDRLLKLKLKMAYIAYDHPKQRKAVERVVKAILDKSGWSDGLARNRLGCYILVGWDTDTLEDARARLKWVKDLKIRAYPMFYQSFSSEFRKPSKAWYRMIRPYLQPAILYSKGYKEDILKDELPLTFSELI